jgi:hypothetical protein
MNNDNDRTITTWYGFNLFRRAGLIEEDKEKGKRVTVMKLNEMEELSRELFYNLVNLNPYPKEVQDLYSNKEAISARSRYFAKDWFLGLSEYGVNWKFKLRNIIEKSIVEVLNKKYYEFFALEENNFDLKDFIRGGTWLSHIKTGSNSGYPLNFSQTKMLMAKIADKSVQIFEKWLHGDRIDWTKLAFEMGMRTERKKKQRAVMMAATYEKPISAVVNTWLDNIVQHAPFKLPRSYGDVGNMAQAIFDNHSGKRIVCKDFEGFDKHIPLHLVKIIRDWLKGIGNTFCNLMAFECDLVINSFIIVGAKTVFKVGALPSGIGITQFLGSMIHDIVDEVAGLDDLLRIYQSDDTIMLTKMDEKEVQNAFDFIEKEFQMPISPLGKKSIISDNIGIMLQKVIDTDQKIYYNHEQRAFTNGLFRERAFNTSDMAYELMFGKQKDDSLVTKQKSVLAYLGNLVSYGVDAPNLPNILSFMYGKKSGFNRSLVEWGLRYIQDWQGVIDLTMRHKVPIQTGWLRGVFEDLLAEKGWVVVTPAILSPVLERVGRKNVAV